MSYFSNALERLIERRGRAIEFATACGVHQGTISRLQRDKAAPDRETLERICSILSPSESCELIHAYLQDAIPARLRPLASTGGRFLSDDDEGELLELARQLSPEKRKALEALARLMIEDEEAAELFVRMIHRLAQK